MLIMLPSVQSHGRHTASGSLLVLETKSTDVKIPIVIGGSEFALTEQPTYTLNRLAEISLMTPNKCRFYHA